MKPMISILAMALMVSMAPAQTKTAAPTAGNRVDTMQQTPAMQNQQMQRFGWREHEFPGLKKTAGPCLETWGCMKNTAIKWGLHAKRDLGAAGCARCRA